jgi:L-threonylcarbamoyladenylate synthase
MFSREWEESEKQTKYYRAFDCEFMSFIKTNILKIDAIKPEADRIKIAADMIKNGMIVVFPTETVYGIGANAFDENACKKVFDIKKRPADNPLMVTVSSIEMALEIAEIPDEYIDKIKNIWPCPIAFLAKAKKNLPDIVTSGLGTVVIRMPAHPVALALIKECGVPIVGPSANPSTKPTATNGKQAVKYFNGLVDCIIDSGNSFFGVESTIIDLRDFKILRPGAFTVEEIEKVFGKKPKIDDVTRGLSSSENVISPGTKYQHYAPETPLFLFDGKIDELIKILDELYSVIPFAFIGSKESCTKIEKVGYSAINLGSTKDLYEVAKSLYDGLIIIDSLNVYFGILESFDEAGIGLAIMNRLRKASGCRKFSTLEELTQLVDGL